MNGTRKFVTTGVGFTFVVVGITGVIFKLFFKNHTLEEIHGWLGLAMVAAAAVHIFQNWNSLRNHLRDPRVYGLLVPIVAVVCFFSIGAIQGRSGSDRGINPRQIVQKLSRANANDLAKAFGKDVNSVLVAMKGDGLTVGGPASTIEEIAQQNQRPPEGILTYFLQ